MSNDKSLLFQGMGIGSIIGVGIGMLIVNGIYMIKDSGVFSKSKSE